MKKIAIIGANKPLLPFFKKTKELGFEIHCFAWSEGAICKSYADFFYPVSFTDKDTILDICREIGIDGITSFSLESALPTVNYVAEKLGLVSNTIDSMKYTSDKYSMRDRLSKFNVGIPRYLLIENEKQLNEITLKYPLIVKPVDNGGSKGVAKANNKNELILAYDRALSFSKSNRVIVEEYIDGREFSVEYISHNSIHYNLAVTDKITTGSPNFIELEHHQPADISIQVLNKIKETTEICLSALKVFNSPSHTELKIDKDNNIFVIEIGPRMGGDRITSDLVKLSTGYDFIKGALDLATNNFSIPVIKKSAYSGVYFWSPLTEGIKHYIDNKMDYDDIIYTEENKNRSHNLDSNLDRNGLFIYKSTKKFIIE